jgi:UDP-N-acetylglucosamine 2-epimerase (non-hydrolysing)
LRILSVVGARPNFIKLAPVDHALRAHGGVEHLVVHTGQHYDRSMSGGFFDELEILESLCNLGVGSGSHAQQTAAIIERFEPVCIEVEPDVVLVYGDVNSTVAAALVAAKLGVTVGHVEAGLRSRDWSMPEEINRVVTDRLSQLLFTPSRDADANLRAEGAARHQIHFVGNVMVDSLVRAYPRAREACAATKHALGERDYVLVTLHRPSNVDDPKTLEELVEALSTISAGQPVLFPVHPRTREQLNGLGGLRGADDRLRLIDPVGYVDMLSLVLSAGLVITDSGGLQEETSYLGVPCVTVRPNTERPITVTEGTNQLVPPERERILEAVEEAPGRRIEGGAKIERWDGRAAERIVEILTG